MKDADEKQVLLDKIEHLQSELQHLKKTSQIQSQLLELNEDAIFVKNVKKELVYANAASLKYYPNEVRDSLIGKRVDDYFSKDQVKNFDESDKQVLLNGSFSQLETIELPDESEIVAKTTKRLLTLENGENLIACNVKDVSERERLIDDLRRSNEDLDNFAYVASHDLRAPLNAIQTIVKWVINDCSDVLPLESKDNLHLVLNRASRMEKLLRDLLEYSRIGKTLQKPTKFNLRSKVLEWLNLVDLPMGFGIRCDDIEVLLPEMPLNVIMINLISNAIKHHDSSTAQIVIKAKHNKKSTVIEVADDGPGIPDEFKSRVFELFQTLRARDEVEASGMGLSVVKKLIEHYGGTITIKDNQPRGCRFIMHWLHQ